MNRFSITGVAHPAEAVDRIRHKIEAMRDRAQPRFAYVPEADWLSRLHAALDVSEPCGLEKEFVELWSRIDQELRSREERPLPVHDADINLARATWCLVRHLRPRRVVETGVARGFTSRVVLEALDAIGEGHLWSVDLPPLRRPWSDQVGLLVSDPLQRRWTYVRGSSRRVLPEVLRSTRRIEMFIHDSLHTRSNMAFELDLAWDVVDAGGVVLADDIEHNGTYATFVAERHPHHTFIARHEGKPGLFGAAFKDRQ